VEAIYTSPLTRARETAAPLAERLGLEPVVVDLLAEFDRHDPVYIPLEELKAGTTEADRQKWRAMLAGNESAERRAWRDDLVGAIEVLIAANRGRRVAAVCHGGVINGYLSAVLGVDAPIFFEPWYCSVNRVVAASSGERSIVTVNEAPFLRDLPTPERPEGPEGSDSEASVSPAAVVHAGGLDGLSPDLVYHVIGRDDWSRAQRRGHLEALPFLHLCTADQLAGVLERYYEGTTDLVALAVDPDALGPSLRWEAGADPATGQPSTVADERFPHLHGPLLARAVLDVIELPLS
jgi:probable phosphoglycerate mutase